MSRQANSGDLQRPLALRAVTRRVSDRIAPAPPPPARRPRATAAAGASLALTPFSMTSADLVDVDILLPVRSDTSGQYEYVTGAHAWRYEYEVSGLGSRSERRAGTLSLDGYAVAGADRQGMRTPWGMMQCFAGTYEQGWLLAGTYGSGIDPIMPFVVIPDGALGRNGEWHAAVAPWEYRASSTAMGSRSENRSGQLSYGGHAVAAELEGSRIKTPWGVMHWMGPPRVPGQTITSDYEHGWLLRGVHGHPFHHDGPWIDPRDAAAEQPDELRVLSSLYLSSSVLGHRVTLSVPRRPAPAWDAMLTLDPNTCQLDAFGDRTICTRIAVRRLDVHCHELRLADPSGRGRRIFSLRASGADALPASLTLITDAGFEWCYLRAESELIPLLPDAITG
jgi:hypothetical protein